MPQRWVLYARVVLSAISALPLWAQGSPGRLTITANVLSSINLVFQSNPAVGSQGYCPLTNSGTNDVSLNLGTASYTGGDTLPCVLWLRNQGQGSYTVTSLFDIAVTKSNTSSPNYQLAAKISTAPPTDVSWVLNSTTLSTSFVTIQGANPYGRVTETLMVQVRNKAPAQTLTETISFLATAN
jgi:hypothetical protein